MIRISVRGNTIVADGHAGYAEEGRDIVCAGVSALCCTLGQQLLEFEQLGLLEEEPVVILKPGKIRLSCQPKRKARVRTECLFRAMVNGLEMLAESYPDYIVMTAAKSR